MRDAHLTRREQEILDMVSAGCSSKEIGRQLGCATLTVETHIKRLRLKLRARTRAEATAIWQKRRQDAAVPLSSEYPESSTEEWVPSFGDFPAIYHPE